MMGAVPDQRLRPIERRVLALKQKGIPHTEIARRFRPTPPFIAHLDGRDAKRRHRRPGSLRPVERRILTLRDRGVSPDEMAERFRRSPDFISRVERIARYKLRNAARS